MANSGGLPSYGAVSHRSSARSGYNNNPDEIQLRIDPMNADLDEEVNGLRSKISLLKNVAQEIGNEARYQNDLISQLQMTVIKAQAGVKNNMRWINKKIIQNGSNHVFHVLLFVLLCFFVVYFLSKFSRG
ncbi:hypothetical protein C5167_039834 [Papaver somniferum]|uniref:t-SNARE coiled-coil homology domain-containing protein n=1 Tax=Papaver somniferum TaxID=3469 RepID=A0A4Y7IFQ1_PAPSO|nr:bet1-like protein At4g14600 [Papaver somniferum]RZC46876.1 hypothetical protein C5167_039834 [Papaver somniferum]